HFLFESFQLGRVVLIEVARVYQSLNANRSAFAPDRFDVGQAQGLIDSGNFCQLAGQATESVQKRCREDITGGDAYDDDSVVAEDSAGLIVEAKRFVLARECFGRAVEGDTSDENRRQKGECEGESRNDDRIW